MVPSLNGSWKEDAAPESTHHSTASAWGPGLYNELRHLQPVVDARKYDSLPVEDKDPASQSWSEMGIEDRFRHRMTPTVANKWVFHLRPLFSSIKGSIIFVLF